VPVRVVSRDNTPVVPVVFRTGHYAPRAFAPSMHNEGVALSQRHLKPTPPHGEWLPFREWVLRNWKSLLPRMQRVKSVSFDEYLSRTNASSAVKRALIQAKLRLDAEGITEYSRLSRTQLYLWTKRSFFVKNENNLHQSPLGFAGKPPRGIQSVQNLEFIVLVGPWIMACQDRVKRVWRGRRTGVWFTSGASAEETAEYIASTEGAVYKNDMSSYDASIHEDACILERDLFGRMGAPLAVINLITANIRTHGRSHYGWRYKCKGTRKSGDPYTSLGNSMLNALLHQYCLARACVEAGDAVDTDAAVDVVQRMCRMLVQGDDNALRYPRRWRVQWALWLLGLGFVAKPQVCSDLYDLDFCSCFLTRSDQGWVFVPKPGRVLAKCGYIVDMPPNVKPEQLARGIALSMVPAARCVPPLRAVLRRVLELTTKEVAVFPKKMEHKLVYTKLHDTTMETWRTLLRHYDWSNTDQVFLEEALSGMCLGDSYEMTTIAKLLDMDTAGPPDIWVNARG